MKKVCVITSTRAEYGLLKPIMNKIKQSHSLTLQLIVTGMHLCPEFGLTATEISEDGFKIDEKVEILLGTDTPIGISKSMGLMMISLSEVYQRLKPELVLVLGDRYEIFAAVSAAAVARIPVAHIHGGETTEGAFDEAFRHCITKMSHIHFTSTPAYRQRVIQLGEHPNRVFNVGGIGIENIKKLNLLSKEELEQAMGFKMDKRTVLVTFHPVTLEEDTAEDQLTHLLAALDEMKDVKIIFTKANADTYGRIINRMIDAYGEKNKERIKVFTSMGQLRYLSAMKYVDAVVGNSSSGIIEAPSFHIPTINIGDRQRGRICADTVIHCRPIKEEILAGFKEAFSKDFRNKLKEIKNPYGDGDVSDRVINIIHDVLLEGISLKKVFYDL